jgi:ornithine decarboxylase
MHGPIAELGIGCVSALSHETPFFLMSRNILRGKLQEFQTLFPGAAIHYALKANSEPEVLQILAGAGACFEAASRYELDLLREVGVEPQRIIYGTSVKPASHIEAFVRYGVDRFAFDTLSELQ